MKKLMSIALGLFVFSIYGGVEDNIMSFLRQRETHGQVNANSKKKIKNDVVTYQNADLITKLRTIDIPDEFILSIPEKYVAEDENSFENNLLMDIIPAALVNANQEFKDDLFAKTLRCYETKFYRYLCVALIEAGANPNSKLQSIDYIKGGEECMEGNYAFAQALLARGANPNVAVPYRFYSKRPRKPRAF